MPNPINMIGNGINRLGDYVGGWFGNGYDAISHKGQRRQITPSTLSEDVQLRDLARRQLTSTHRDLIRNFAIAGFMVRKHLDYVSSFHFRSKSGDKGLDREIEQQMEWWARPENCDSAGRHSLPDLMRMWESLRTIDGDCLINRLSNGKVQTIEGDRIQTYGGIPFDELGITDAQWVVNGVWISPYGRALGYMVFRRPPQWTGLQWDRMVPAQFADLFGYYGRIDQVRGISPLASAANSLRDVYEGLDYALLKAKVSQYFGMIITRQASEDLGQTEKTEGETDPQADPDKKQGYDIKFGRAPLIMDMDPGDDARIIESQQPSTQFQGFTQAMIQISLKALDLPFSFFDESHTNYSGSRMAGVQYEESAKSKRHRLRMLLNKLTAWRLGLFIADDELVLPKNFQPSDLKWEWSHAGVPLFDPMKEVTADIAAVNAGFASPQEVCRARGKDYEQIIQEIAQARKFAADLGVTLSTALPSLAGDDPNKSQTQTEDQNVVDDKSIQRSRDMWNF